MEGGGGGLQRCACWDGYRYASFHVDHDGLHTDWCGDWSDDWNILQHVGSLPAGGEGRGCRSILLRPVAASRSVLCTCTTMMMLSPLPRIKGALSLRPTDHFCDRRPGPFFGS